MTTTLESSALVESAMEDTAGTKPKKDEKNKRLNGGEKVDGGGGHGDDTEEEECDVEVWDTLSQGLKQVQAVLDQNRQLIQQVNENHRSKIPDHLVKNVDLIREINGNISKVLGLYSDLSVNFLDIVRQRKKIRDGKAQSADS